VIALLRPELSVISVGERNSFGHPAPEVVAGYRAVGAQVVRTDYSGAITVESDGVNYSVFTMADQSDTAP
jgi:competence protein ComEC